MPFPYRWTHSPFKTALWFGGFQALFPLLGYFAASTFSKYVTAVDHWIIFGLLALIGGNMVREAFKEHEENGTAPAPFDSKHMLPLAVACSIDAFAVGVSFAFMSLNIWISVIIIGITTGLFSAAGQKTACKWFYFVLTVPGTVQQ